MLLLQRGKRVLLRVKRDACVQGENEHDGARKEHGSYRRCVTGVNHTVKQAFRQCEVAGENSRSIPIYGAERNVPTIQMRKHGVIGESTVLSCILYVRVEISQPFR